MTGAGLERYDLVSAPVIDSGRRVIGRITVADVVDFIREIRGRDRCPRPACEGGGHLRLGWSSVKNRWAWLAINLVTLRRLAGDRPVRDSIESWWRSPR